MDRVGTIPSGPPGCNGMRNRHKKDCRFVQVPRKPLVTFDSRNQCLTKIFNENVADYVWGVGHLDFKMNGSPHSSVENRQHPAIR
jgi:hypothetical protein